MYASCSFACGHVSSGMGGSWHGVRSNPKCSRATRAGAASASGAFRSRRRPRIKIARVPRSPREREDAGRTRARHLQHGAFLDRVTVNPNRQRGPGRAQVPRQVRAPPARPRPAQPEVTQVGRARAGAPPPRPQHRPARSSRRPIRAAQFELAPPRPPPRAQRAAAASRAPPAWASSSGAARLPPATRTGGRRAQVRGAAACLGAAGGRASACGWARARAGLRHGSSGWVKGEEASSPR